MQTAVCPHTTNSTIGRHATTISSWTQTNKQKIVTSGGTVFVARTQISMDEIITMI